MPSPEVRAELDRYGISALVGPEAYFDSIGGVLDAFQAEGAHLAVAAAIGVGQLGSLALKPLR